MHCDHARTILDTNFWGVEEWKSFYGVDFSDVQLRAIESFPWKSDILLSTCPFIKDKRVFETHFAFLGVDQINNKPLTIDEWRRLPFTPQQRKFYYDNKSWYRHQAFAVEPTCSFRWYLMPLKTVRRFAKKTWSEQLAILPEAYEVPLAIEEITKNFLFFRKNGALPQKSRWARCLDTAQNGLRIRVGYFRGKGISIISCEDEYQRHNLGLTSSRKLP